jgi:hypothetical protein
MSLVVLGFAVAQFFPKDRFLIELNQGNQREVSPDLPFIA